jgi:hypothetical protein
VRQPSEEEQERQDAEDLHRLADHAARRGRVGEVGEVGGAGRMGVPAATGGDLVADQDQQHVGRSGQRTEAVGQGGRGLHGVLQDSWRAA